MSSGIYGKPIMSSTWHIPETWI